MPILIINRVLYFRVILRAIKIMLYIVSFLVHKHGHLSYLLYVHLFSSYIVTVPHPQFLELDLNIYDN